MRNFVANCFEICKILTDDMISDIGAAISLYQQ